MTSPETNPYEAIRALLMRYTWHGDNGPLEEFANTFAQDGVLDLKDRAAFRGRQSILDAARTGFGTDAQTLGSIHAAGRFSHHIASIRVELIDEQNARSWSYFAVFGKAGPDHWGRYTDALRKVDGAWCFAKRRVSIDGAAPASVFFPDF